MTKEETLYNEVGSSIKGAEPAQMMGMPCFKVKGKMFSGFFEGDMVFKLHGDAHREALSLTGSKLFDPGKMSRPMKEWVKVTFKHRDKWEEFAKSAFSYVKKTAK